MLAIIPAEDERHYEAAAAFVAPHEKYCCLLMQKILAREEGLFLLAQDGELLGAFFFCEEQLLLPCLPERNRETARALLDFFGGKRLFCLTGKASFVQFLQDIFAEGHPQELKAERRFIFMEHTARPATAPCEGIRRCTEADAETLMPLHLGYMREEVLLPGMKANPAAERLHVEKILSKERVFAVERNGSLVAKAQTNAQSPHYIQIGGVYTENSHRGQGLASSLTAYIAAQAEEEGRRAVLFVDVQKEKARHAYERAGFTASGSYRISYYEAW